MSVADGRAPSPLDVRIADARERARVARGALDDAWREVAAAVGPPAEDAAPAAGVSRAAYHSAEAGPELEAKIERLDRELQLALAELNDAEREKGAQVELELRSRAGTITDERGKR